MPAASGDDNFAPQPPLSYAVKLAEKVSAIPFSANFLSASARAHHPASKALSPDDLLAHLQNSPELQAQLASQTGYTPSKWLLELELDEVNKRRAKFNMNPADSPGDDAYQRAVASGLMGISFSGGGIRSATFNLGILQGLAELHLLPCFDYLSTVSGGGYIHQWFAAWTRRIGFAEVARELIPLPEVGSPPSHPEPIRWLRRYSNYLTPEKGLFTADSWVVVATWLRNTLLNQITLISGLLFLVLLPFLLLPILRFYATVPPLGWGAGITSFFILAVFLMTSFFLARNLWRFDRHPSATQKLFGQKGVQLGLITPLLAASLLSTFLALVAAASAWRCSLRFAFYASAALLFLFTATIVFSGKAPLSFLQSHHRTAHFKSVARYWRANPDLLARPRMVLAILGLLLAAVFSSFSGAACIAFTHWWIAWLCSHSGPYFSRLALVTAPPMALLGLLLAVILVLGLLGRTFDDARREWLARLGAWMGLYILAWMVAVGFSLFGFFAVKWFAVHFKSMLAAIVTWAGATLSGLLAGKSAGTSGPNNSKSPSHWNPIEILAVVGPYFFIAGLLLVLSAVAEFTLRLAHVHPWWILLLAYLVPLALCLLFAWRVDINEFSMHAFYRNRLARCYLGASNASRDPNPFSGFDNRDEHFAAVKRMPPKDSELAVSELLPDKGYDGPFPIFCASLNLTFGEDLAWQERKAASFAFTPLYSGYDVAWTASKGSNPSMRFNGYAKTSTFAYPDPGIHVSTAAAISGAAMSPNWGFHTNPATAFLMTLFNVRLGWWLRNPRLVDQLGMRMIHPRLAARQGKRLANSRIRAALARLAKLLVGGYPAPSPQFSLLYLLGELLGHANDTSQFVYLSDGGHFDNMGLYELVRRRCRFIVICDAEADPDLKFEGIAMAIRNCRIDFGAEISLDLRPLQHPEDSDFSPVHCVVGAIVYPEDQAGMNPGVPPAHEPGIVVYIKSSITGDEPGDILNYKKEDPAFPHDSTVNQWFTESQFESYRRLGHHVALSTFQPAGPAQLHCQQLLSRRKYFENLRKIWAPLTPEMRQFWAKHTKRYGILLESVRKDPKLPGLFDLLFVPGDGNWKTNDPAHDAYAVAFSSQLLEFMWIIFAQLDLVQPENQRHPFATGWIEIFRNWSKIDVVCDAWLKYGPTYSLSFRIFAVCNVHLPPISAITCDSSQDPPIPIHP